MAGRLEGTWTWTLDAGNGTLEPPRQMDIVASRNRELEMVD